MKLNLYEIGCSDYSCIRRPIYLVQYPGDDVHSICYYHYRREHYNLVIVAKIEWTSKAKRMEITR